MILCMRTKHTLRDLRDGRGYTQKRLGELAGVTPRTISRLERGDPTSTETLYKLAEALNHPISTIIWAHAASGGWVTD